MKQLGGSSVVTIILDLVCVIEKKVLMQDNQYHGGFWVDFDKADGGGWKYLEIVIKPPFYHGQIKTQPSLSI